MNTETYLITAVVGFIGTLSGMAIGYYKSKAEMPSLIEARVKKQCETCGLKKEVFAMDNNLKSVAQDLKDGNKVFATLKTDIAVIKTKLGIRSDIKELKEAIAALEDRKNNNYG